jgi:sulfatase maturation enzyme AslB (radical SAM superfamily)
MKFSSYIAIIYINIVLWIKKLLKLKIIPYKTLINLTDLCNSRCNFCDIWKIKPKDEIDIKELTTLFQSLNKNLYWLSLSGGEVTLVKYYKLMIDKLIENCKNIKILAFTTNALAVDRAVDYALYAKNKGLDVLVTISLDGDEKIHNELRGIKNNYQKCFDLYYKLKKNKINCNFGITISEKNSDFVLKKYVEYKNLIKAVTFVHNHGIFGINKNFEDDKILTSLKHIYKNYPLKKIEHLIEKIHLKISIIFLTAKRNKNIIPCDVINSSIHIMPNGDVKPCMFMESLGNIRNQSINAILSDVKTTKVKELIKRDKCPKCWMNCYSPHTIMQHPIKSIYNLIFN